MWCAQPHTPKSNRQQEGARPGEEFPKPPEQPQGKTMTIQVGNERFAIHRLKTFRRRRCPCRSSAAPRPGPHASDLFVR